MNEPRTETCPVCKTTYHNVKGPLFCCVHPITGKVASHKLEMVADLNPDLLPHNSPNSTRPFKILGFLPFIRNRDLVDDTMRMIPRMPNLKAVVGISRSGVMPASIIAANTGCELFSIDQPTKTVQCLKGGERTKTFEYGDGEVLLVDDSIWSGRAMKSCAQAVLKYFGQPPLTAAIYINRSSINKPHFYARELTTHFFEWNIEHVVWANHVGWDLDGVLCPDFTAEQDDDGDLYIQTMREMPPTHFTRSKKPKHIITARLEKYREETEQWLGRNGVIIDSLTMGPWETKQEREQDDVWKWKADRLVALGLDVMVESNDHGAQMIAEYCGANTIATDSNKAYFARRSSVGQAAQARDCILRGDKTRTVQCITCSGIKMVDVFSCEVHGECRLEIGDDTQAPNTKLCATCKSNNEGYQVIPCDKLTANGTCQVASSICGGPAMTTPQACRQCFSSSMPKATNPITVTLAIGYCKQHQPDRIDGIIQKHKKILEHPGFGLIEAGSFASRTIAWGLQGAPTRSNDEIKSIIETCGNCPSDMYQPTTPDSGFCRDCKCPIEPNSPKVVRSTEHCPKNHW